MAKKSGSEKVLRPVFGKTIQYVTESSYQTTVDIQGESHAGQVRPVNEDSFLVISFSRSLQPICTNLSPSSLPENYEETGYGILVADGLGGRPGGDVASKLAISELIDLCIQTPDWIMRPNTVNVREVLRRMKERFGKIANALADHAVSKSALLGMGTTLTTALSIGKDLVIAHVGASRAYIFRKGNLMRLTHDHTLAQLLSDVGVLPAEYLPRKHARKFLIGSITSTGKKAEVELLHFQLEDDDKLLICSDGLTEMVGSEQISAVLGERGTATDACHTLTNLALAQGGVDNVTVVVCHYHIAEQNSGAKKHNN